MSSFKQFFFSIFLIFILSAFFFIFILNYFKIKILIETLENIDTDAPVVKRPPGYKGLSLTILQPTVSSAVPITP